MHTYRISIQTNADFWLVQFIKTIWNVHIVPSGPLFTNTDNL